MNKFQAPINPNYAAVVVRISSIIELENCDNVVGTPLLGYQAVVGKDTAVGDLGIMFPAESQLSDDYCSYNNLYRHGDKNKDESAKGYIEDNRRVKAVKFRGHRSDCLFMPLESLVWTKANISELQEGDTFDRLGDFEICRKYVVFTRHSVSRVEKNKHKVFKRVDEKYLPEHYDTENYFRNMDVIKPEQRVVITQKLHGTSIRIGNTVVRRKNTVLERLSKLLGARIAETEYDYVFGSRKVIKDINNPNQNHFYTTDIWTEEGQKVQDSLPQGFVLYGEIVGWTKEGAPIQKNYTYRLPRGECRLFVYRIAHINPQGIVTDLSWDQVKEFCRDHGLSHVPELWTGPMGEQDPTFWLDQRFNDDPQLPQALPLDDGPSLVDEGICIRLDGLAPYILKAKSPIFLQHESKMLDQEAVDLEAEGSEVESPIS